MQHIPQSWRRTFHDDGFVIVQDLLEPALLSRLRESMDQIKKDHGKDVDYMRIRAYPFAHEVHDFVAAHERVYVVEQDRDAQLASLLKLDLPADQVVKLRSILHYNGLPIDARTITEEFVTKEGL